MTLDFPWKKLQAHLPLKEALTVFKSDRSFRETCKYTFILIPIECFYVSDNCIDKVGKKVN